VDGSVDGSVAASNGAVGADSGAEGEGSGHGVLLLPTLNGPAGLFRVSTTDTGPRKHLRLLLSAEFFSASDVLVRDDRNQRLQGALAVGFTPLEHLELFGAFLAASNRNRRVCQDSACVSEAGRTDPEVIKAFGDIILGAKYARPVARGFAAGGEFSLRFLSSVSGLSVDPGATSVSLRGLAGLDLRALADIPVRAHLNVGHYVDQSSNLQDFTGVSQPSELVSSFAYGIAKSRFRTAVGVDAPLPALAQDFFLLPFAEYHLEYVTGGANPAFQEFTTPFCSPTPGAGVEPCRDNRDQQWVTLGVRALIPGGVVLGLGVDIGARSAGFPYGPPLAPWNLVMGLGVPLDLANLGRKEIVTRTVTVEKEVPVAAAEGVVTGKVFSAKGNIAIPSAVMAVVGRPHARTSTDPDGSFTSHRLPPGILDLEFSAPGYLPQSVRAEVAAGMATEVEVALVPKAVDGTVSGRVTDARGKAVVGRLLFDGVEDLVTDTDAEGWFSLRVPAGDYTVRAEASEFLNKEVPVSVEADGQNKLDLTLRPRKPVSNVVLADGALTVRVPVVFKGAGDTLDPRAQQVLDELVDVLVNNPRIKRLIVETHWDSALGREGALALTRKQADKIAAYLTGQGIAADRVRLVPKGADEPIAPNISGKNRTKNRRVVFKADVDDVG
jgi:outer membrane protein OmpA-like peptidoglycan-associated protein